MKRLKEKIFNLWNNCQLFVYDSVKVGYQLLLFVLLVRATFVWKWVSSIVETILTGENQITRRKPCLSVALSTKNVLFTLVFFVETSVSLLQTTQHHFPQLHSLNLHHRYNLEWQCQRFRVVVLVFTASNSVIAVYLCTVTYRVLYSSHSDCFIHHYISPSPGLGPTHVFIKWALWLIPPGMKQ
jgi:hypothetical protein